MCGRDRSLARGMPRSGRRCRKVSRDEPGANRCARVWGRPDARQAGRRGRRNPGRRGDSPGRKAPPQPPARTPLNVPSRRRHRPTTQCRPGRSCGPPRCGGNRRKSCRRQGECPRCEPIPFCRVRLCPAWNDRSNTGWTAVCARCRETPCCWRRTGFCRRWSGSCTRFRDRKTRPARRRFPSRWPGHWRPWPPNDNFGGPPAGRPRSGLAGDRHGDRRGS